MLEKKNWFEMMQTGVYIVEVDRTALYDKSAIDNYRRSVYLTNDGDRVESKNDIIQVGITILAMIDIDKRGYPFIIRNKSLIKEIVEIIYNHISVCMEVRDADILRQYPVPIEDLIEMEEFMMKVLQTNPKLLVEDFMQSVTYRLKTVGMGSMFEKPNISASDNETDKYRRVTDGKGHYGGIDISDLLNDI